MRIDFRPARPLALVSLAAVLFGCERPTAVRETISTAPPHPTAGAARVISPVVLPQVESSNQGVHPDGGLTPPGAFAYPWHLVLTPYPYSLALVENPYVFASPDALTWAVEPGAVNPVARPRPQSNGELLSDPALVYVPESQELWLYYRSYTPDSDRVWLIRSADAVNWTPPALVFAVADGQALSPSVVHRAPGEWLMWTVSGHCAQGVPHVELRRSVNGLAWSAPEMVSLPGLAPWHVFVRWVESLRSWVLATNVKTGPYTCLTKDLYLATSSDGLSWKHGDSPWLSAGEDSLGLFPSVVYRTAFAEVGDSLRFWYSGAAMQYRTSTCHNGTMTCTDSSLVWSRLGTEIRAATDVLLLPIQ